MTFKSCGRFKRAFFPNSTPSWKGITDYIVATCNKGPFEPLSAVSYHLIVFHPPSKVTVGFLNPTPPHPLRVILVSV